MVKGRKKLETCPFLQLDMMLDTLSFICPLFLLIDTRVTANSINKLAPVSVFLKSKITSRCSPESQ